VETDAAHGEIPEFRLQLPKLLVGHPHQLLAAAFQEVGDFSFRLTNSRDYPLHLIDYGSQRSMLAFARIGVMLAQVAYTAGLTSAHRICQYRIHSDRWRNIRKSITANGFDPTGLS